MSVSEYAETVPGKTKESKIRAVLEMEETFIVVSQEGAVGEETSPPLGVYLTCRHSDRCMKPQS